MLRVGLDLSRKRIEVCLISDQGEVIDRFAAIPDRDGLYGLARRVAVYGEAVRAVVESMNGARFVHDELTSHGWEVLVADAQKVKGWRRWHVRPIRSTRGCSGSCRLAIWCRRSGCLIRSCVGSGSAPAFGCIWSSIARA